MCDEACIYAAVLIKKEASSQRCQMCRTRLGIHPICSRDLWHGGFVVTRQNLLRDILAGFCRQAHLSVKIEVGYGLSRENINSRPADIYVQSWDRGHLAAFDVTVTSPLTPAILNISSIYEGAAGRVAEARKHTTNDAKCQDLGWLCIPLAGETYGNWGKEAHEVFNRLASLLAFGQTSHKSGLLLEIYSHVNLSLVSSIARAILGRALVLHSRPADLLVNNWHLGKPAAFDLTITSPLNPITLTEAGVRCGSSALFAEARKHNANDSKCAELGWVCIPLAVESYGCWGTEAQQSFSRLAARLAIQMGCSKSQAPPALSRSLVRANARACSPVQGFGSRRRGLRYVGVG
eukprot:Em0002g1713a